MSTFDDREKGFERKFAHDAEMQFRAEARRNKLVGHWAAEKMGVTGTDADAYAQEVVKADFEEPGHEDVVRKLVGDFGKRGVEVPEAEIREALDRFLAEAKAQLMDEHG